VVWAQILCRFIIDKKVELRHILFHDGGNEYVICWQHLIFFALKFIVVLYVYIFIRRIAK